MVVLPHRARCVLLAWLWLAAPLSASAGTGGSIVGTLVDETGGALPGAAVLLRAADGLVATTVATGPDGRFEVRDVGPGRYTLEVTLAGFERLDRIVTVAPEATISLRLVARLTELAQQIIVKASRTGDRRTTDTPLAVTTVGSARLSALGVRTPLELSGSAPSLTITDTAGFSHPALRGIATTAFFAGSDPSVATYVDGVYVARASATLADLIDVDRIEIVRGPQGALYGRNALAGLVHVFTREPSNERDGRLNASIGPRGLSHVDGRASGALRDRLMASLAVSYDTVDGFVRDLSHPDRPLGGRNSLAGAAKLRAIFSPTADLLLSFDAAMRDPVPLSYNRVLRAKEGFTLDVPSGFWDVRTTPGVETYARHALGGVSARLRWMPRRIEVQSLAAARWTDTRGRLDSDFTELPVTVTTWHQHQWQFSEELTARAHLGRVTGVTGLLWFIERDLQPLQVLQQRALREFRVSADSRVQAPAAFASASVDVGHGLALTGGIRYGVDRKRMLNRVGFFQNDAVVGQVALVDARKSMGYAAPQIGVEWRTRTVGLAYVSVSNGHKSGGYNPSIPDPGTGYAPERTGSVEVGVKRSFGSDRGWLHALAHDTRYTDLQVQTTVRPGVVDIRNAADARLRGAEFESVYRLGEHAQVDGSLAYLDARYRDYLALGLDGRPFDAQGKRLSRAPLVSGRAGAAWSTAAARAGVVRLRAEVQAMSRVFFTPVNDDLETQGAYALVHASAALDSKSGHWTIGLFGRNLTDQRFIVGTVSSSPVAISAHPGERRSIGVEFSVRR